jgi:hypothetical protein
LSAIAFSETVPIIMRTPRIEVSGIYEYFFQTV